MDAIPERLPNKVFMLRSRKQGSCVANTPASLSAWSQALVLFRQVTGSVPCDKGLC